MDVSTLLHQIQGEAIDGTKSLADLLRKARVLAQRIGSDDLKNWAIYELEGYPLTADLPSYRIVENIALFGELSGFGGAMIRNMMIPTTSISEKVRDAMTSNHFRQGGGRTCGNGGRLL